MQKHILWRFSLIRKVTQFILQVLGELKDGKAIPIDKCRKG